MKSDCSVDEPMNEFAARNERRKKHFGKVPVKKKMRSVILKAKSALLDASCNFVSCLHVNYGEAADIFSNNFF